MFRFSKKPNLKLSNLGTQTANNKNLCGLISTATLLLIVSLLRERRLYSQVEWPS